MYQKEHQIGVASGSCHSIDDIWMNEKVLQNIKDTGARMGPGPRAIILACKWRYFTGKDLAGLKRLTGSMDFRIVRMPCSGQVELDWITSALDGGAGAVLVMGGHDGVCPYQASTGAMERSLKRGVEGSGFDPFRLVLDWSTGECPQSFLRSVDQLVSAVGSAETPA